MDTLLKRSFCERFFFDLMNKTVQAIQKAGLFR